VVWDIAGECDATCDITDPSAIAGAVAGLQELPSLVTITAGVGHSGLLVDASAEEWDTVMAVNARGPWLCLQALARAMRAAQVAGSLIATSSVSAHLVDRSMGLYCASKAALSMVVQVAAAEWGPSGQRHRPGHHRDPHVGRAGRFALATRSRVAHRARPIGDSGGHRAGRPVPARDGMGDWADPGL
jgi:NAD(P)-dependent dehydrogenase (short-subunit alcohol dehydrogenase family)